MPLTRTPLLSETVRKLVARGAYVNAYNILNRLHPADIAGILADLPEHLRREAFKTLHKRNLTLAGAALSELGPERGASILSEMSPLEVSELLQGRDADEGSLRGRGPSPVSRGDRRANHEPEGLLAERGDHYR